MPTHDPIVAMTYGPSGVGKTTDLGYSFPRALFLAAPGALTSIERTCGFRPDSTPVLDIQTATDILERVATKYNTVVIDDFSFMAEQTLQKLEGRYSGFTLWGELRRLVLEFRDKSRKAGVNVFMNAWEQPPKKNASGQRIRGGPKLSGNLPEAVPALCDIVLRAVYDTARQPWPVVYQCSADPNWILKDRFDLVPRLGAAPMNLAEILRASGVEVERHPEYPDQESRVEALAQQFTGDPSQDLPKANQIFKAMIDKGVTYQQARWTMRDAVDRAVIRAGLKTAESSFVVTTGHLF